MKKLLVIHGPNLNLLGIRQPNIYGRSRLEDINNQLLTQARDYNLEITCYQFNAEHEIINRIHHALHESIDLIIINPAAFTHTSVAIRDALLAVSIPFIEVHLSNIHKREDFRRYSYFSDIALGTIAGFGDQSYVLALHAAKSYLKESTWIHAKLEN